MRDTTHSREAWIGDFARSYEEATRNALEKGDLDAAVSLSQDLIERHKYYLREFGMGLGGVAEVNYRVAISNLKVLDSERAGKMTCAAVKQRVDAQIAKLDGLLGRNRDYVEARGA